MYEERLRDVERKRHERKMKMADHKLEAIKIKLHSAQQLYDERLKDL